MWTNFLDSDWRLGHNGTGQNVTSSKFINASRAIKYHILSKILITNACVEFTRDFTNHQQIHIHLVALAHSYHTPHRLMVQHTDIMCDIPSTPHVVPTRVISSHMWVLGFRIQQPTLAYELSKERGVMWTNFLNSDRWLVHDARATWQNVTSWRLLTPLEALNIIYWARFWSLMHVEGVRWNLLVISLIINKSISTYWHWLRVTIHGTARSYNTLT
jgi:hypothetical protein